VNGHVIDRLHALDIEAGMKKEKPVPMDLNDKVLMLKLIANTTVTTTRTHIHSACHIQSHKLYT